MERGVPIVKKVKILFLRRWYIMGSAALLAAAAIFYAANYPALLQSLIKKDEAVLFPVQTLDTVSPPSTEQK